MSYSESHRNLPVFAVVGPCSDCPSVTEALCEYFYRNVEFLEKNCRLVRFYIGVCVLKLTSLIC